MAIEDITNVVKDDSATYTDVLVETGAASVTLKQTPSGGSLQTITLSWQQAGQLGNALCADYFLAGFGNEIKLHQT